MRKKNRYVANEIATHLPKDHLERALDVPLSELGSFCDDLIRRKKAAHYRKPYVTRKVDRPKCGAKTRAGGKCQALPVWDKTNDKPRNGRCRLHGGLSTGPKGKQSHGNNISKQEPKFCQI